MCNYKIRCFLKFKLNSPNSWSNDINIILHKYGCLAADNIILCLEIKAYCLYLVQNYVHIPEYDN